MRLYELHPRFEGLWQLTMRAADRAASANRQPALRVILWRGLWSRIRAAADAALLAMKAPDCESALEDIARFPTSPGHGHQARGIDSAPTLLGQQQQLERHRQTGILGTSTVFIILTIRTIRLGSPASPARRASSQQLAALPHM